MYTPKAQVNDYTSLFVLKVDSKFVFTVLIFVAILLSICILSYSGAFGYFECTHDITRYTKADVFSQIGKRTDIAVRFSQVSGESGSADTVRFVYKIISL